MAIIKTSTEELREGDIGMIGLPWDTNSSYLTGSAEAPTKIIESIDSPSANYYTESLIDLNEHPRLKWLGDAELDSFMDIESQLSKILKKGAIPFSLGGDHSVAYPVLRAISRHVGKVTIIQFDAHNDLYHDFEGNPYSHASPFARIMEGDLAARLIQVGIRTMTTHQQQQASDLGVEVYSMQDLSLVDLSQIKEPLYISFDMDVLDPAFAPGVSHHEPGGMSTREAISMLQSINAPIVGMDLVEYNPHRDPSGMTGMVAAKIAKEMLALLLR